MDRWRRQLLCAPADPWPERFWGPETCDPSAWLDLIPLLDPAREVERLVAALAGVTSIADVGGGTGLLTRAFAAIAPVVVIEPSLDQLAALAPGPGITIAAGRAEALPLADHSVDAAVATWVLQYTRDPDRAVDELIRVARHRVVLVQAAPDNDLVAAYNAIAGVLAEPPAHHGFLLARAAARLAAAGFAIQLERVPTPLAIPAGGVARVGDIAARLHHAGHPRLAELAAAAATALAPRATGATLSDDGVVLVALR